jgi:hypothetical protein
MISSRHITGATSTTVHVSSSPDWSAYFFANLEVVQDDDRGLVL